MDRETEKMIIDQWVVPGTGLLFGIISICLMWLLNRLASEHGRLREAYVEELVRQYRSEHRNLLQAVRRRKTSGVYFIGNGEAIKIGVSEDIGSRFQHLQTASHLPLRLLAVVPGASREVEQGLHREFQHLRLGGEWFRPGEEILERVAQLRAKN